MQDESQPRIYQLFEQALDLRPQERESWLRRVCHDDQPLCEQVLKLLQADDDHNFSPVSEVQSELAALLLQSSEPPDEPVLIGQQMGRYYLLDQLGEGGMGKVYKAHDDLGRDVALKLLPEEMADDPVWIERLEQEARKLARLKHPNIAGILGREIWQQKRFLVLEYVPGTTLAERLKAGPLKFQDALPVFAQIVDALSATHEKDLIHRDLKPANIMLTPKGQVKLLDFGIARYVRPGQREDESDSTVSGSEATVANTLTRPGSTPGTPSWMSPEQIRGETLDQRADLWAFGVICYETLTGQHPFRRRSSELTTDAILNRDPDWKALRGKAPKAFQALIRRCLDRQPETRLSQAAEAAKVVRKLRRRRETRRERLVAAALAVIVLGGAGWWGVNWSWQRIHTPLMVTVLPFQVSGEPDYCRPLGSGMEALLFARLMEFPSIGVIPSQPTLKEVSRNLSPGDLARQMGVDRLIQGTVSCLSTGVDVTWALIDDQGRRLDGNSLSFGRDDPMQLQSEAVTQVVADLKSSFGVPDSRPSGTLHSPEMAAAASSLQSVAEIFRQAGSSDLELFYLLNPEQLKLLQQVIERLERLREQIPDSALVQAKLGQAYLYRAMLADDDNSLRQAVQMCDRARELDHAAPDTQLALGHLLLMLERPAEAVTAFTQALSARPGDLEAMLGLAQACENNHQSAEAEQKYLEAARLRPNYWGIYNELGAFYFSQGRFDEAAAQWRKVTQLSPLNPVGFFHLGSAYFYQNKINEARQAYHNSLSIQETGEAYASLGAVLYFDGQFDEAVRVLEQGLRFNDRNAILWGNLGDARRWSSRQQSQAAAAYQQALALATQRRASLSNNASVVSLLAEWQIKSGLREPALRNIARALALDAQNPDCLGSAIRVYEKAGQRRRALTLLDQALTVSRELLTELRRDPDLRSLLADPAANSIISKHP